MQQLLHLADAVDDRIAVQALGLRHGGGAAEKLQIEPQRLQVFAVQPRQRFQRGRARSGRAIAPQGAAADDGGVAAAERAHRPAAGGEGQQRLRAALGSLFQRIEYVAGAGAHTAQAGDGLQPLQRAPPFPAAEAALQYVEPLLAREAADSAASPLAKAPAQVFQRAHPAPLRRDDDDGVRRLMQRAGEGRERLRAVFVADQQPLRGAAAPVAAAVEYQPGGGAGDEVVGAQGVLPAAVLDHDAAVGRQPPVGHHRAAGLRIALAGAGVEA